jgi:hypothetical protein
VVFGFTFLADFLCMMTDSCLVDTVSSAAEIADHILTAKCVRSEPRLVNLYPLVHQYSVS